MKFSVVVPVFNEAKFVATTLRAVRNQTVQDLEIIVKDGLSRDQTVAIAKKFADKVVSTLDSSAGEARNQGAQHANGEVLVFVDADSRLHPSMLERFSKLLDNEKVVGGSCRKIPLSNHALDRLLYEFVNISTFICSMFGLGGAYGNCMFIRKEVFEHIGGFNPNIIVAEEQELVRRASKFGKFVFLLDTYVLENPRRLLKWGRLRLYLAWFKGMFKSLYVGKRQVYEKVR